MEKSKILSAFFWGYPVLQIIAGNIAEKFGAKQLIFVAMTSTGLLTIIIPMLADWGYFTVCILRILQGVLQVTSSMQCYNNLRHIITRRFFIILLIKLFKFDN